MSVAARKKHCPDCGRSYFNEGWHNENCEGPRLSEGEAVVLRATGATSPSESRGPDDVRGLARLIVSGDAFTDEDAVVVAAAFLRDGAEGR